jgi:hypothetical protein
MAPAALTGPEPRCIGLKSLAIRQPSALGPLSGTIFKARLCEVQQSLLFIVLLFVHFSDFNDLAHDLRLETAAFGFGIDFLDIFAKRALPVFESLYALDK